VSSGVLTGVTQVASNIRVQSTQQKAEPALRIHIHNLYYLGEHTTWYSRFWGKLTFFHSDVLGTWWTNYTKFIFEVLVYNLSVLCMWWFKCILCMWIVLACTVFQAAPQKMVWHHMGPMIMLQRVTNYVGPKKCYIKWPLNYWL